MVIDLYITQQPCRSELIHTGNVEKKRPLPQGLLDSERWAWNHWWPACLRSLPKMKPQRTELGTENRAGRWSITEFRQLHGAPLFSYARIFQLGWSVSLPQIFPKSDWTECLVLPNIKRMTQSHSCIHSIFSRCASLLNLSFQFFFAEYLLSCVYWILYFIQTLCIT